MVFQSPATVLLAVLVVDLTLTRICVGWLLPSRRTRCYEDPPIGCFPTSYPYNNTGVFEPQSPDRINVQFYFHKPQVPRTMFNIRNADQVLDSTYNSSAKTVVIIHGYLENGFKPWIQQLGNELLRKDNYMNVVVVNWQRGSMNIFYLQSVANARVAGAVIALLLEKLTDRGGRKSSFHVIGFSLGAHVAGYVGSRVIRIGRITGLDPAGPGFHRAPPEARLDETDARFVDVIHTHVTPIVGMGTSQPMGTVDFYPNRGTDQPGCPTNIIDIFSAAMSSIDLTGESLRDAAGCSHLRATSLFTATINANCTYITQRCHTTSNFVNNVCRPCVPGLCPLMGYNIDKYGVPLRTGLYQIFTTGTAPYC